MGEAYTDVVRLLFARSLVIPYDCFVISLVLSTFLLAGQTAKDMDISDWRACWRDAARTLQKLYDLYDMYGVDRKRKRIPGLCIPWGLRSHSSRTRELAKY